MDLHLGTLNTTEIVGEGTTLGKVLDVATIGLETAGLTGLEELLAGKLGETPLLGDNDALLAGELVLGTTKSLHDDGAVVIAGTDGEDDLTNVDTGNGTLGLTEGAAHTGLKTISTGTGQHLVDPDNVEGVDTDAHVEGVLTGHLADVLVAANTASLEGLGRKLLLLVGDHVDTEGEVIDSGLLPAQVVDADLGVGDTTAEPRLGIRLVLAVAVATSRTATHSGEGGREG